MTTLFNTIDEDNSGTVELEELAEACRRLGLGLSPDEMARACPSPARPAAVVLHRTPHTPAPRFPPPRDAWG